jgi:tetratricopeptide (TPR) repeat protein
MKAVTRWAVLVLGVCIALQANDAGVRAAEAGAGASAGEPLYEGLGAYSRKVTAASPEAEKYVQQGLKFYYGFVHGAALRSFEQAVKLDPDCAMAYWGIALANGPHINFPLVPPENAAAAWKNLQLAKEKSANCNEVEKDLIEALSTRYANPQPEDRTPLDRAYADAMRKVWEKHRNDPDVGVFFAEALMDLSPWNQWTKEGKQTPGTDEVLATLDEVLKLEINHPMANHLYIHAMEASNTPDKALPHANRLRELQPGLAHNVHMPTHIDIRVGNWQEAVDWNAKAIEAAQKFRKVAGPAKGLLIFYDAHNYHMLAWGALMTGQRDLAVKQIDAMVAGMPDDFIEALSPAVEGYGAMPYEVRVRFGMWDEVLAMPKPNKPYMPFTNAFHHAARAIALGAKGDTKAARAEQKMWEMGLAKVPAESTFHNNKTSDIATLMSAMIEGELLLHEGKTAEGLSKLREAVKLDDNLHYDEPPAWMIPARHALGAFLLKAGQIAEAEQVYRDDLKHLPNNGWSLQGLSQALKAQGKDASEFEAQFAKVWAKADLQIKSSCLCQQSVTLAK